jgi:hypothetical protein
LRTFRLLALALALVLASPVARASDHHRHARHHHRHAAAPPPAKVAQAKPAPAPAPPAAAQPISVHATPAQPAPAVAAPPVWYDFKGAKLGMTLADWKALPFPGGGAPQAAAQCSDDPAARIYLSDTERRLGIVQCRYAAGEAQAKIPLGDRWATADYGFAFLDGKLFRITVRASLDAQTDVDEGLVAKWGKPTSETSGATQTEAGGSLTHKVKTWINPAASIVLQTPGDRLDELSVAYSDLGAVARLEAAEQTPRAPASAAPRAAASVM